MQSNRQGLRLAALCLALGAMALAQDKSIELKGAVVNSVTGEPVARAHVTLLKRSADGGEPVKYAATTNAQGDFSIQKLAPGSYFVTAERVGFTTPVTRPITIRADEQPHDVTVKLTPWGAVSGRVLDANGEPIDRATVTAERGQMGPGNAETDEKGQFRIGGLEPGKYRLKAVKREAPLPPEIRTDGTAEIHYASTYYPGSLEAKSAAQVEVTPGNEMRGIEIRMIGTPVLGIRGRIVGMPANAGGAAVSASRGGMGIEDETPEQAAAPDGSFALWRLDPGRYSVSASAHTPSGREFQTELVDVEVAGSNVDRVELRMLAPVQIAGHLEFDDEKARGIVHGQDAKKKPDRPLELVLNDEVNMGRGSIRAKIAADDSFRLEEVLTGRYLVSLPGLEGAYIKSMRLGQTEIAGTILDLTHGAEDTQLSLAISSATGSVSGTVSSSVGGAAGSNVALLPGGKESEELTDTFFTTAKADGTYAFEGLRPGKYRIVVVDDKAFDAGGLVDYQDLMEEIEVRAGEKVSKDLTWRGSGK